MDHIINGPYQSMKKDPTTKIKTKTLTHLKVLKNKELIDNKLYYYLKLSDSPAPRFYGKDENNNAKNSSTFSNYIRNTPIDNDEIMVSFQVTSCTQKFP